MNQLKTIIKNIRNIKPVSSIANKLIMMISDEDTSMDDIAEVISYDASATANLLKAANSAYFGSPGTFETVKQAVIFLGSQQVIDLVIMSECGENLKREHPGYSLAENELWRYSVSSALIAKDISLKGKVGNASRIFTAALLKDIGKTILDQYVAEASDEIETYINKHNSTFRNAEQAIIGVDHTLIGGAAARLWNFSPELIDIIEHHHNPNLAKINPIETSVVYVADVICMMMGMNSPKEGLAYKFQKSILEKININEKDIQTILMDFPEKLKNVEEIIALA